MDLTERQEKIYQLLTEKETVSIREVKDRFSISLMTVHRDVDRLISAGLAQKSRNTIKLARPSLDKHSCCMCGGYVSERNKFIINQNNGEQMFACCSHCGLLKLSTGDPAISAFVTDFLYGTVINVLDATYVVGSAVRACCSPTIFNFAIPSDARLFQKGFGGKVLDFQSVNAFIQQQTSLNVIQ